MIDQNQCMILFIYLFMTMYEIYKCESQIKLKKECSNFQDNLFII